MEGIIEQQQIIGKSLCDEAEHRFAICGAERDFCIQSVDSDTVVFGGTNRVVFGWGWKHPMWRVERSYCTGRFLREWDAHYGE